MAGSLFDRMALGEAGTAMDEDESIRLHIERMFTSRQGSVPTLPDDYGLPDLNDLTLSKFELSQKNCRIMAACISKYEPRLVDPQVSEKQVQEHPFVQGFVISAQKYDAEGRLSPWRWEMTLENGRIRKGP
jgi:type VI secretion system protein